jgi:ribosome-interacting GTPase 1
VPSFNVSYAPHIRIYRHEWNLEELLETIWDYTKMIRIYTKVLRLLLLLCARSCVHWSGSTVGVGVNALSIHPPS